MLSSTNPARMGVLRAGFARILSFMSDDLVPALRIRETDGRCRLWLGSFTYGDGSSLQEAADDLVRRLLGLIMSLRSGGEMRFSTELGPNDLTWYEFLHELGEIAGQGGDIRARIFGGGWEGLEAA